MPLTWAFPRLNLMANNNLEFGDSRLVRRMHFFQLRIWG